MKKIIKLIAFTIIIMSFNACSVLSKDYFYEFDLNKYIELTGTTIDSDKRDTPIDYIEIRPINYANYQTSEKVEILSDKIKAVYDGKEYYLNITKSKRAVLPYDEGVILKEGTVLYFGKVRVDDKMIMDMPPVKLKQTLKVIKFNPIAGGLNIDTMKHVYYGPPDQYKGR